MLLQFYKKDTIAASLQALAEETANTIVYIFPKLASNTSTEIRARKNRFNSPLSPHHSQEQN
jgi:predicted secreted Zn-dependent protease